MRNKTSTWGSPSRSTLQHSQGLTCQGDCHLEHRHFTAPPGSATADVQELRYLESLTGDDLSVSISEALQLSSCPIIPTPPPACGSSLADHLSGELDSAQVALSLGYVAGENRASSIDSPLVDHARGYWVMQGHAFDHIMNHNTTPPPSYSSTPLPHAIEQSSGYLQESGDVSKFGDLGNSFAGPAMGLGFIPSLHNCTSGEVIGADAPWSRISNPVLPLLQDPPPLDDFNIGDIPLLPEQTHAEIEQIRAWTPFPYTYPIPSPSNSTSYSASDGRIPSYPSFLMPDQNSSSRSPQERLRYPLPIHPHPMRPADLPGFHGLDAGSKMALHTSGTLNDYSVQTLGDHPSHTLFNHTTYIPDNNTAGGGVDDYGNVDDSKFNTEQVVGPLPQLLLPPNQLPLSRKLHSRSRMSRTEGGSLSGTFHHTRHFATGQSKLPSRLAKARSVRDPAASYSCGWRDDKGRKCGMPINYDDCAGHLAAFHHIKGIAWNVKVICCWCPSEPRKEVIRKNLLRHLREAHLYYPRPEKGI